MVLILDTMGTPCTSDLNIDAILPVIAPASRLCESVRPNDANLPESWAIGSDCAMERRIPKFLPICCRFVSDCTSVLKAETNLGTTELAEKPCVSTLNIPAVLAATMSGDSTCAIARIEYSNLDMPALALKVCEAARMIPANLAAWLLYEMDCSIARNVEYTLPDMGFPASACATDLANDWSLPAACAMPSACADGLNAANPLPIESVSAKYAVTNLLYVSPIEYLARSDMPNLCETICMNAAARFANALALNDCDAALPNDANLANAEPAPNIWA
jgi:hypothetical protein